MSNQRPARSGARPPSPGEPGDRRAGLVVVAAAIAILLLGVLVAVWLAPRGVFDDGPDLVANARVEGDIVVVRVEQGENVATLGARLEELGVITSARLFRVLVTLQGYGGDLQAGDYEFRAGQPIGRVIDRIRSGATAELRVTIPEGRRIEEAGQIVEAGGVLSAAEFMAAATSFDYPYNFVAEIPAGAGSLQGFLFPDTYGLSHLADAEDIVDLMLATFDRKVLTEEVRALLDESEFSLYEVVTLASIVEREAQAPEERAIIAGVFLNRLRDGIPLQADPTVQFAVAQADPESVRDAGYWKRDLTLDDLAIDSPYNTYVYGGLPPGPICNPGYDSILAVLAPAVTDFVYFVARPDGTHAFAVTLEEHNQNVAQYSEQ